MLYYIKIFGIDIKEYQHTTMISITLDAMDGVTCQACCNVSPARSKIQMPPNICARSSKIPSSKIHNVALNISSVP